MAEATLGSALEREHREIDGGIEAFLVSLGTGAAHPQPLISALNGLRRHIYLEETFLFPPLRESGMTMPIFVMLREHGGLWQAMDALEPQLADGDPELVQQACRELLSLLDAHNSKEEPIIYAQADSILNAEVTAELRAFLDAGEMPAGWSCDKA